MNSKLISRTDRDSVAVLTFERSAKLNALNYELVDAIVDALNEIEQEDGVRAVVLTGSGRAFSAGADIHEFSKDIAQGADVVYRRFVRRGQGMARRTEAFPKPVISAVNGLAYGGGCEIVEATHLSLAVPDARFAKAEIAASTKTRFRPQTTQSRHAEPIAPNRLKSSRKRRSVPIRFGLLTSLIFRLRKKVGFTRPRK